MSPLTDLLRRLRGARYQVQWLLHKPVGTAGRIGPDWRVADYAGAKARAVRLARDIKRRYATPTRVVDVKPQPAVVVWIDTRLN